MVPFRRQICLFCISVFFVPMLAEAAVLECTITEVSDPRASGAIGQNRGFNYTGKEIYKRATDGTFVAPVPITERYKQRVVASLRQEVLDHTNRGFTHMETRYELTSDGSLTEYDVMTSSKNSDVLIYRYRCASSSNLW